MRRPARRTKKKYRGGLSAVCRGLPCPRGIGRRRRQNRWAIARARCARERQCPKSGFPRLEIQFGVRPQKSRRRQRANTNSSRLQADSTERHTIHSGPVEFSIAYASSCDPASISFMEGSSALANHCRKNEGRFDLKMMRCASDHRSLLVELSANSDPKDRTIPHHRTQARELIRRTHEGIISKLARRLT